MMRKDGRRPKKTGKQRKTRNRSNGLNLIYFLLSVSWWMSHLLPLHRRKFNQTIVTLLLTSTVRLYCTKHITSKRFLVLVSETFSAFFSWNMFLSLWHPADTEQQAPPIHTPEKHSWGSAGFYTCSWLFYIQMLIWRWLIGTVPEQLTVAPVYAWVWCVLCCRRVLCS